MPENTADTALVARETSEEAARNRIITGRAITNEGKQVSLREEPSSCWGTGWPGQLPEGELCDPALKTGKGAWCRWKVVQPAPHLGLLAKGLAHRAGPERLGSAVLMATTHSWGFFLSHFSHVSSGSLRCLPLFLGRLVFGGYSQRTNTS